MMVRGQARLLIYLWYNFRLRFIMLIEGQTEQSNI